MGNADTKLNFRKAIVQLANKNQVSKDLIRRLSCFSSNRQNR